MRNRKTISFSLSNEIIEWLDKHRGFINRSIFVEEIIKSEIKKHEEPSPA